MIINIAHLPFYTLVEFVHKESDIVKQSAILVKSQKYCRLQRKVCNFKYLYFVRNKFSYK